MRTAFSALLLFGVVTCGQTESPPKLDTPPADTTLVAACVRYAASNPGERTSACLSSNLSTYSDVYAGRRSASPAAAPAPAPGNT